MTERKDKANPSLMRNLGSFFGHIIKGVKTDPAREKTTVRRTVEEEKRGDVVLRRTTIEEVEIRRDSKSDPADENS